jgi:hypothetical protein
MAAVTVAAVVCLAKVLTVGRLDAVGTAMAVVPRFPRRGLGGRPDLDHARTARPCLCSSASTRVGPSSGSKHVLLRDLLTGDAVAGVGF